MLRIVDRLDASPRSSECSWCGTLLRTSAERSADEETTRNYGICPTCLDTKIRELTALPLTGTTPAGR